MRNEDLQLEKKEEVIVTEVPRCTAYFNTTEIGGVNLFQRGRKEDGGCDKVVFRTTGGGRERMRGGRK